MNKSNRFTRKPIALALGAVFALAGAPASADQSSVFKATDLGKGYQLAAAETAKTAEGKCGEGMKDMGGMKHMDGMSMTGDADYDFAANMRKHHQMAVDMSEAQLKKGKDADMLKMAKSIIVAQKKEIAELDRWLAAHKKPK
ncbi:MULTISPECIES: DUF305 domain-containing protein [Hydrocarboniphaga]|jgi:uncharacterized protein (DUF305 family)|uniref:DUF305 domain-containing protein n=1 Tax=Hydrocarboniphaga effusa AP103 TaxID=1172194 RepID=I8T254_9GAMM|nr:MULTISPECIES: DUF305 domain-containing protein [Hydrocarboniphaga]EIT67763.1 hypothetical protein WQQ_41980 [Hydrocarboniphaga effusa AP103]MDZ4079813.1 DUF305 domain-containing protein [Hydrocarboniphaga sp.]